MDCFALIRSIVHDQDLSDYRVYTNGPGQQEISYCTFTWSSGETLRRVLI